MHVLDLAICFSEDLIVKNLIYQVYYQDISQELDFSCFSVLFKNLKFFQVGERVVIKGVEIL